MFQAAHKMTNFTMSPDAKPGLPSQLIAEMTGVPSALRLPTSATEAYRDPSAKNIFHMATDAAGLVGGGVLAKGAVQGVKHLRNVSNLSKGANIGGEAAVIANTSRASRVAHGTHSALEGAHNAEVSYKNVASGSTKPSKYTIAPNSIATNAFNFNPNCCRSRVYTPSQYPGP